MYKNKDYHKIYRQQNKARLEAKHSCYCGGQYTRENYSRHCKTKKHLGYIESEKIEYNGKESED